MLLCAGWLIWEVGAVLIPFALIGVVLVFAYIIGQSILDWVNQRLFWYGALDGWWGYLSITQEWSWDVALASLPYAIGATIGSFWKTYR